MLMLLLDDKEFIIESRVFNSALHCWRKKENENTGLDFPISIENWFNLSTIEHVINIIFCILSVWLCFLVLTVVCLFSFFSVVRFPFHPQSASSSFFFLPFILVILLLIFLKPHFFVCAQIGLPAIRNGTYVMYGTYIVLTLLHFRVGMCRWNP